MKQTTSSTEHLTAPSLLVNASLHTGLRRLDDEPRARAHICSSFRNPAAIDDYHRAAELLHAPPSTLTLIDSMIRVTNEIDLVGYWAGNLSV